MKTKKQPAVIFDRDGTLASVAWCAPKQRHNWEWARFNALLPFDPVVPEVAALFQSIRPGVAKIVVSGRMGGDYPGDYRRTYRIHDWLYKHALGPDLLLTRLGGDTRKDSVVKRELYENFIEPYYDVRFAVDDRQEIVDLWRSLDIPVLQVKDPGLTPMLLGGGETCRRCGRREGRPRFYVPGPFSLAGVQEKYSMKLTIGCQRCWEEFVKASEHEPWFKEMTPDSLWWPPS